MAGHVNIQMHREVTVGRFALEARDVTVNAIRGAAEALDDPPDQPAVALERAQRTRAEN